MKKNILYLVSILILAIVVVVYFLSNPMSTMKRGSGFAVEHSENIDNIILKKGEQVTNLSKKGETWMVNDSYIAHKQTVESFLTVISNLEVFSPVAKSEKNKIADELRTNGTRIKIFYGKKLARSYYLGIMPSGQTVMIAEKSNDPYIVRVPSLQGNLHAFFKSDKNYWRSRIVFDIDPQDIDEIECHHPANQHKSFRAINYHDGSFGLMSLHPEKGIDDYEIEQVVRYFAYFRALHFEEIASLSQEQKSQIITSEPLYEINLKDVHDGKFNFKVYMKPQNPDDIGKDEMVEPDFNRAYARLNNSDEILIIQYYVFDPILKEIDYFRKP